MRAKVFAAQVAAIIALVVGASQLVGAVQYQAIDLGTLVAPKWGITSTAFAINDNGQIAGSAVDLSHTSNAVIWNNRVIESRGTGYAYAISSGGAIAGTASESLSPISHVRVWDSTGYHDLASANRGYQVCDISSSGGVIGTVAGNTPYLWDERGEHAIQIPTGYSGAVAERINASGQMVGAVPWTYRPWISYGQEAYACAWDDGVPRLLGQLDGYVYSEAQGLNDNGVAVGYSTNLFRQILPSRACLWDAAGVHDLGVLSGCRFSRAYSINNSGIVVGESYTEMAIADGPMPHACYWDGSGAHALDTLPGYAYSRARDINSSGWIVGESWNSYGNDVRATLWIPTTPEPSSVLALSTGLAAICGILRLRRGRSMLS